MRAADHDHGLVILSAWRSYLLVEPSTVPLQRQFSKTVNIFFKNPVRNILNHFTKFPEKLPALCCVHFKFELSVWVFWSFQHHVAHSIKILGKHN